jgi:hypothetical protein
MSHRPILLPASCDAGKKKNKLRSFSCSDVSNGGLTLEKEVFQKYLARLEKLVKKNSQA